MHRLKVQNLLTTVVGTCGIFNGSCEGDGDSDDLIMYLAFFVFFFKYH